MRKERQLHGPFQVQPRPNAPLVHAEKLAQFGQARGLSSNCQHEVVADVSCLFLSGCPPDIERPSFIQTLQTPTAFVTTEFVWPTINSQPSGTLSENVGETRKMAQPITNDNARIPITLKGWVSGVRATLHHIGPRLVSAICGLSVRCLRLRGSLLLKTPARLRMPSTEAFIPRDKDVSAIALNSTFCATLPVRADVRLSGFKHDSSSKTKSDGARFEWHNGSSSTVVFSGGRPTHIGARCDFISSA